MKKGTFYLISAIIFSSCTTDVVRNDFFCEPDKSTKTILLTESIEHPVPKMSEYIDSAYIIALQTPNFINGMVSRVKKIVVSNEHIYVLDSYKGGSVAIFNKQGDFIRRIETGRGNGEIINAKNIVYNFDRNELLILHQDGLQINIYSSNGTFKNRYDVSLFSDIIPYNDGYFLFQREWQNPLKKRIILQCDSSFVLDSHTHIYNTEFYSPLTNDSYFDSFNDSIYFSMNNSNSIYVYQEKHMKVKYKLDCVSDFKDGNMYEGELKFFGSLKQTSTHICLRCGKDTSIIECYVDKMRCNVKSVILPSCKNDVTSYGILSTTCNDFFVRYIPTLGNKKDEIIVNSEYILSTEDLEKLKKFNEENNPLLIFYRIKDFANE